MFPKIVVPAIIHFNRVFHYKPSVLGYHYFRKHPYVHAYPNTSRFVTDPGEKVPGCGCDNHHETAHEEGPIMRVSLRGEECLG